MLLLVFFICAASPHTSAVLHTSIPACSRLFGYPISDPLRIRVLHPWLTSIFMTMLYCCFGRAPAEGVPKHPMNPACAYWRTRRTPISWTQLAAVVKLSSNIKSLRFSTRDSCHANSYCVRRPYHLFVCSVPGMARHPCFCRQWHLCSYLCLHMYVYSTHVIIVHSCSHSKLHLCLSV